MDKKLREKIRTLYITLPRYDIEKGIVMIEEALPELAKEAGYVLLAEDQTPPNNPFNY